MALKLGYDFTAEPNPIRASAKGRNATANLVDIQVLISNPGTEPVGLTKLTIEIPVGEVDTARALSSASSLPDPVYDRDNLPWDIASAGSTVTITPKAGSDGTVGIAPLIFHLDGIEVDTEPGIVPITITEFRAQAPKAIDSQSYHLLKQPADLPVTRFWAEPAELYDVDQSVTLKWETTDQGKNYSYSLHSDDWQPKDCLDGGDCFGWQDGDGVQTPALAQTTTFALDVIKADAAGHRTIRWTVPTKVRVKVPRISDLSRMVSYSGRLARLHWMATDAARCSIELDGRITDDNAPVDTYHDGYWIYLGEAGTHQLSVIAHAASGDAQVRHSFQLVETKPSITVPLDAVALAMAVSRDGALALVACEDRLVFVDALRGVKTGSIALKKGLAVAITPDGTLALVSDGDDILFINLADRANPERINVAQALRLNVPGFDLRGVMLPRLNRNIAITPNGKLAFVSGQTAVFTIDIANRRLDSTAITGSRPPGYISITPDGKLALVGIADMSHAPPFVIDIASRQALPPRDDAQGMSTCTFPLDSKFALVAYAILSIDPNIANSGLYPFDIEQRRWMSSQPLSQFSQYVAFSADGALGFTEIITDLAFIDVHARGVLPFRINIPDLWCPELAMRQQRMFALIHPSPMTAITAQKPPTPSRLLLL